MYRKTLGVTFTVIGLVALILGIYAYAFSTETLTQTITIDPSDGFAAQLEIEQGDVVRGALIILDGNEGITVLVENPATEVIYNGGTVYTNLEFSFNAQTTGLYALNFDNLSSANQQTIEYSLTHSTFSRTLSLAILVIGAILLAVGITTAIMSSKKNHS
jgi:hypothetical protein